MRISKAFKIYETMMEKDFCSQWMGVELEDVSEGYCKIKMTVKREMLNGFGILHGGIAYAFADSAFAFASNSYGRIAVSITGQMNFAKSAREGTVLFATAKALNVGFKNADFDVDVSDKTGEIYYRFRGTVYRSSKDVIKELK